VTVTIRQVGRPRIHNSPAERTAAWRQRQRLASIGITTPAPTVDRDLVVDNARLRARLERMVIELAAARTTIARLQRTRPPLGDTPAAAAADPRPAGTSTPPAPPSRPLPPPQAPPPSQVPLPAPTGAPVLNRAQRRQADREQRRHNT